MRRTADTADSLPPDKDVARDLDIRLDPPVLAEIDTALRELDLTDSNSIIFFGSKAQEQLSTVSDSMLEQVRVKDMGSAGDTLSRMVQKLRELDVVGLDSARRSGLLGRLMGGRNEVQKVIDRYGVVREQVDTITADLERHKTRLLTDIVRLDKLYDANLAYFRVLEVYIAAGRAKLKELDERTLPALARGIEASEDVVTAQKLRDLRSARDDLERRVHDLLLTRQVTMQALPSIRLVQENDKSLVTKINSTVINTVPLWRQQLAQAITVHRMGQAADAVKAANDLTNDLLQANAEGLRKANATVKREVERGVFDIDAVRAANQKLVATINDSLQIADEAKRRRAEAEGQLKACEAELRQMLASASARAGSPR